VNLPVEDAFAFLLVVDVLALVSASIGPLEHAFALHFIILPLALVNAAIRPVVNA
jgi:hypothetical protein